MTRPATPITRRQALASVLALSLGSTAMAAADRTNENERKKPMFPTDILADAGRLVAPHAMVWIRRLDAPIADVWRLISTLDGLAKWWIVPPSALELRPGGVFKHHWENTVYDFREGEFIDFREPNGSYVGTGGMRLEVREDGEGVVFSFLDTWAEGIEAVGEGELARQPGGPGTPWAGVAGGWHHMVDTLEAVANGADVRHGYEELCDSYVGYLRDLYRWHDAVQRRG